MAASPQDKGPPTVAAIVVATAIVSGLTGFYIGQARSLGLFGGSASKHAASNKEPHEEESDMSDASSEGGDDELGDLKTFADATEECKLVLVVRTDLGMGKGKRI